MSPRRRRSLLASYFAAPLEPALRATAALRHVRMAPAWFEPPKP